MGVSFSVDSKSKCSGLPLPCSRKSTEECIIDTRSFFNDVHNISLTIYKVLLINNEIFKKYKTYVLYFGVFNYAMKFLQNKQKVNSSVNDIFNKITNDFKVNPNDLVSISNNIIKNINLFKQSNLIYIKEEIAILGL